jgi:dephospho-CoA kinase
VLRVALTGNLGAGKSTVGALFRGWGARVIDADDVAREIVARGEPAWAEIEAAFGPEVLATDRSVDRAALRRRVAADPQARRRLETILHPRIRERIDRFIEEAPDAAVVVAVVPLLFETGMEGEFDRLILVDAPEEVRVARTVASGKMSEAEARALATAQRPAEEKRGRVHYVLQNGGDLASLEREARRVWDELWAGRGSP